MGPRPAVLSACLLAALAAPSAAPAAELPARDTEPVVLTGKDLAGWAAPHEQTVRLPGKDYVECPGQVDPSKLEDPTDGGAAGLVAGLQPTCPEGVDPHNHYAEPDATTAGRTGSGVAVDRLLGFRWNGKKFEQIRFQVDEVFTRYLNNTASGFSTYSGEDRHTSYAFDREGFRWTASDPENPCLARPASPVATDPVRGLDTDDELAFLASDAGGAAPAGAPAPKGVEELREVRVSDPARPGADRFVYVARTGAKGPDPEFTAETGYVRYERDATADLFAFSESSYSNYGNARTGPYCDEDGAVIGEGRRRPRDTATVTTDRYRFRYDGRWLMTELNVARPGAPGDYGRDLVDRWKARAFAQDPGSETPCCGYEEEETNWGGSSTLLGERSGPVRTIRETWGADSGTNVIRRETFYRDEVRQKTFLRVHVIPPLDGIYAQWDFNAGAVDTFFTQRRTGGVAIDGRNDEVFGNLDDPCNPYYDDNDTSDLDQTYRTLYRAFRTCDWNPYHQSVDLPDVLGGSGPNAGLEWAVTSGDHGTVVDRLSVSATDLTPGGGVQSVLAAPYYRDDSCFDDGTGSDPGPKVNLRSGDEPRTYERQLPDGTTSTEDRRCWTPDDEAPDGSQKYFQGSIGTHGVHLLAVAESDNARLTVPVTEIVSDWRLVMLPGRHGAEAGERYGRSSEVPLVATARPFAAAPAGDAAGTALGGRPARKRQGDRP